MLLILFIFDICTYFRVIVWVVSAAILVGNIVPMWYLSIVHQRGTIDVMQPLHEIAERYPHNTSLLFLMPCHSTPLYRYLLLRVLLQN